MPDFYELDESKDTDRQIRHLYPRRICCRTIIKYSADEMGTSNMAPSQFYLVKLMFKYDDWTDVTSEHQTFSVNR